MVVDEGNVDGEKGEGVEVVDPPPCAPTPSPGPHSATARKAGAIPWSAPWAR